jgi:hypothetical protein
MARFKWVVEVAVDESWVADGFNLTNDRANSMLQKALPYAYSTELRARVLKAPSLTRIAKAQGYASAADLKRRGG